MIDPDITDFLRLEGRVWRALVEGDGTADAELLSDDFVGVYPTGFADRADHVRQLADGPTVTAFELSDERLLALSDDMVLLAYRADYRRPTSTAADGPMTEAMYVSSLWCRRHDRWVNVFSQDTPAPLSPAAVDVIEWLLQGDPAIRWQVLRDLTDASPAEFTAERARVEHVGWGARLLALEGADGLWAGGACFPAAYTGGEPGQPWTATMHTLQTLQLLGLDPASEAARRAIPLVAEHGHWEHAGQRYFDGEVEPCINGRTIEAGAYFGVDVAPVVERILGERLPDGGWNCEAENGSERSSFHTTIDVLDGLVEFERATGGSAAVSAARRSGEEYLLERSLLRRQSTGEVIDPAYLDFAFPYYWRYDVLRALDYFRAAGVDPDPRMAEAVEVVRSKRQPDGRWLLDRIHPGRVHFDLEEGVGAPSRWNTLRALRVLQWWERGPR